MNDVHPDWPRDPEVEHFLICAFDVMAQLDLLNDPKGKDPAVGNENCRFYIALAFPNLTDLERALIFAALMAVRTITSGVNTPVCTLLPNAQRKLEQTIREVEHRELPQGLRAIDESGLRDKLTEFQKKLLDDLLRVWFP